MIRVYELPGSGDAAITEAMAARLTREGYTHFKYGRRIWTLTATGLGDRYYPNGKPGPAPTPAARLVKFDLRVTDEQKQKLRRLGGAKWLIKQLEMQP